MGEWSGKKKTAARHGILWNKLTPNQKARTFVRAAVKTGLPSKESPRFARARAIYALVTGVPRAVKLRALQAKGIPSQRS